MSATGDKRRRSDLDLFVLALVADGVSTPYRMQIDAGLSQGATIPALRRLKKERLVTPTKAGPRGRIEYLPTAAAAPTLRKSWKPLLEAGPTGDLDADLRIAILALREGKQRNAAIQFLREAAACHRDTDPSRNGAGKLNTQSSLAEWYAGLRKVAAAKLLRGQYAAALAVAQTAAHVYSLPPEIPPRRRK